MGGVNGAGKTTVAEVVAALPECRGAPFLNPDVETARLLAERSDLTKTAAEFLGLRIVMEALLRAIAAGRSVVIETVFASNAILRVMDEAKATGFLVVLYFVGVPTVEENIARVARRVTKGGHNVPEDDIRRRWPLAHANLARAVGIAHQIVVIANIGYGGTPTIVASADNGRVTILEPQTLPAVTAALTPLIG